MTDVGQDLFELIQMLTNGDNIAIRPKLAPRKKELYDLFRQQETYNASEIKAGFKDADSFNLSNTKRQLYRQILDILHENTPGDHTLELQKAIGAVQVLMRKALFKAALAKVDIVIEAAAGLEALHDLLKALRLKRQLLEILNQPSNLPNRDHTLSVAAIEGLAESSVFEAIFSEMNEIRGLTIENRRVALDRVAERVREAEAPKLVRNIIKKWRILYAIARMQGRHDESESACNSVVMLLEGAQSLMGDPLIREEYCSNLHYLIAAALERGEVEIAQLKLRRLEIVMKKWNPNPQGDPIIRGRILQSELMIHLVKRDVEAVRKHVRSILRELDKPGRKLVLTHKPSWHGITLIAAFLTGEYRVVRKLSYELRRRVVAPEMNLSFTSALAIFYLAAMYEESDPGLEDAIEAMKRWLTSNNCFGEYEASMLEAIEKLNTASNFDEKSAVLIYLRNQLNRIFSDPLYWEYKSKFRALEWIESKLSGKSMFHLVFP